MSELTLHETGSGLSLSLCITAHIEDEGYDGKGNECVEDKRSLSSLLLPLRTVPHVVPQVHRVVHLNQGIQE